MFRAVRVALILTLATMGLAAPTGLAEDEGGPVPLQCVNVFVSDLGKTLTVFATLSNAVGVGLTTDEPGDGTGAKVLILPDKCGLGGGVPDIESAPSPLEPLPDLTLELDALP